MSEPADQPATGTLHVGYETSDVRIVPLLQLGAALGLLTAVVCVAIWALQVYFEARERRLKESELPLAAGERGRQPPAPRLEGISLEYAKTRARRDAAPRPGLTPVQATVVEKAMKELENKLPVRARPPATPGQPPSDANSGRGRSEGVP